MGGVQPLRLLLSVLFSLLSLTAYAESKARPNISVGIRQPVLTITVDDQGSEPSDRGLHEVVYSPKVPTIGAIGGSYGSLSLSYSHNLDGENEDELDYTDYRFGVYHQSFGIDASYTDFEHFRISESSGFDNALEDSNRKRLGMASRLAAVNMYWLPLRLNYDLAESFEPSADKHTGAGLGLIGSYNRSDIETRGGMIPDPWQKAFGPGGKFETGTLTSANLQVAVAATVAPGPFYLSTLVAAGVGEKSFRYSTDESERQGKGQADKLIVRASAGYSADATFFAMQLGFESPRYLLKHMSITSESSDLSALFGVKL